MADLWYARVDETGTVIYVACDDIEPIRKDDIPLDPTWYWGQAPGIIWSDPIHGNKYIVHNGRLYPKYDNEKELVTVAARRKAELDAHEGSPILGPKKRARMPAARQEARDHIDQAVNENEIEHARIKGY